MHVYVCVYRWEKRIHSSRGNRQHRRIYTLLLCVTLYHTPCSCCCVFCCCCCVWMCASEWVSECVWERAIGRERAGERERTGSRGREVWGGERGGCREKETGWERKTRHGERKTLTERESATKRAKESVYIDVCVERCDWFLFKCVFRSLLICDGSLFMCDGSLFMCLYRSRSTHAEHARNRPVHTHAW